MSRITDLLKLLFHSVVLVTLAAPLFLAWSLWRILTGVATLPHHVYQMGDDLVFHFYQRVFLILIEDIVDCKVYFHGDVDDIVQKKERALYVVNHQSSFDWVAVNMLAERAGSMGTLRYIVKQSIQSLPLYGFYFHEHGCIYVNREQLNQYKMKMYLAYLQNKNIPSNIVIFPEGSRFIPGHVENTKKSDEFARSQGLPPMKQHLMPRTTGFVIAAQRMRHNLDAVYSITLIYDHTKAIGGGRQDAPGLLDVFTGKCDQIQIHVRRIPIDRLPEDDKGLKMFLFDLFYEKDKLLDAYYNSGKTPGELADPVSIPCHQTSNHMVLVASVVFLCVFLFNASGQELLLKTWLYGSIFGYSWLGMNSVA